MELNHSASRGGIALAAFLGGLSLQASAQSLAVTSGTYVTYTGDTVPDQSGVDIPTYTLTSNVGSPALDDAGNVYFFSAFVDSPATLTAINNAAFFYGSKRSNLKMGLRANDQAPGQPVGFLLRTLTGSSTALSSNARLSNTGSYTWSPSNSWDSIGTVTTTQSLFGGPWSPFASQTLIQKQGDAAPGCSPETYAQTFSGIVPQSSGNNANGHVYWQATLTGPTADRFGIFEGLPGSLTLVQRSNQPANGIPNTYVLAAGTPFGGFIQINNSNQVMYEEALSTILGASPALISNDRALVAYTPPSTYNLIVREGDSAPGTFGGAGPSFATFNAATGDAWTPGMSGNNWTRSGKTCFVSELRGGDVSGTTNNAGLFTYNGALVSLAVRKGAAALPTDANFSAFTAASYCINDAGSICFAATLSGGTSSTADDTGIWAGTPGFLNLVAREGQVMPGTGGSLCGALQNSSPSYNDQGRVLFASTLTGGSQPGASVWVWDPTTGLQPVLFANDVVEVAPTVFKTLTGATGAFLTNNGDGAANRFTNTGYIGFRATIAAGSGGGSVVMVIGVPTPSVAYCSGDGSDTACPCANPGLPGRGCDNTSLTGGANVSTSGIASISTDTLKVIGTNAVPFGPGLYYEGNATANPTAPFGVTFGNGLRCAGGATNRLEIAFADMNGKSTTTLSLSALGAAVAGTTYYYQLWYRDGTPSTPLGTCNPSAGFNFSNARSLAWVP